MKDMFSISEMKAVVKTADEKQRIIKEASILQMKDVFLSYSSDDSNIIMYVYDLIRKYGGRVYLDRFDSSLSNHDFQQVASRLSQAAMSCSRMVLLVSKNVSRSIWIPWEIGLGHGFHSKESVALFFASDDVKDTKWREQEYLGMYQWIVDPEYPFDKGMFIYDPVREKTVKSLSDWIKEGQPSKPRLFI